MSPGAETPTLAPPQRREVRPSALVAALSHLAATQAALDAVLRDEPPADARGGHATGQGDGPSGGLSLVAQLATSSLRPWAERRPWTLVALAATAGALLASRRGRGFVGAALMAALLAPPPGRLGVRALGRGLGLVLRRPQEPPR